MASRVILLSGPVASGKTTLAEKLVTRHGHRLFKTRDLIWSLTRTEHERAQLQRAGERLDRRTGGRWVADALAREVAHLGDETSVVVDSVRIKAQVEAIRNAFGPRVVHIHVTAPVEVLARRYRSRSGSIKELKSYSEVRRDPTERQIGLLEEPADVVIDTQRNTPEDVFVRVASHLGLYGRGVERLVDVLSAGSMGARERATLPLI